MTSLRQQMTDQMTVRGMAEKTKEAYLRAVTGPPQAETRR
jgi:hypothetical protein